MNGREIENYFILGGLYELQSTCPAEFDSHGFLVRDYAKLQEGPLCPLFRAK